MKQIGKYKRFVLLSGLLLLADVSNATAALDWNGISINTTDIDIVIALVIVCLATLWGFRKVIKTMNRS